MSRNFDRGLIEERPKPAFRIIYRDDSRVQDLDARLQNLSDRLPEFTAESALAWVKGEPDILDPGLDLRVKVDAVRWMLRVAKHVKDPARARILVSVQRSLEQLEHAIEMRPHAA